MHREQAVSTHPRLLSCYFVNPIQCRGFSVWIKLLICFRVGASIWSFSRQMQFVCPDLISCSSVVPCRYTSIAVQMFVRLREGKLYYRCPGPWGPCCLWWNALWVLTQLWLRPSLETSHLWGFRNWLWKAEHKVWISDVQLQCWKLWRALPDVSSAGTPENDGV